MIEDLKSRDGAGRRLRLLTAGAAVILGATSVVACGDSSDDAANGSATTAKAAQTTAAKPAQTTAANPDAGAAGAGPPKVSAKVQAWSDAGTMRLAAIRIGTPGKLVVEPKGNMDGWDHWYPAGTEVTVSAKNTKTAKFAEWSGACVGKDHVCKVKLTEFKRLIAGFNLDKKGAKGLKAGDPALKFDTGSPGS